MGNKLSKAQTDAIANAAGVHVGVQSPKQIIKEIQKLTDLTTNIFMTDFIDTLNLEDNPFDVFIKRDIEYGAGVRYVSTGVIASQEFQEGQYTPDLMGSKDAPDYEDTNSSLIQSVYPLKFNAPNISFYFKNSDNFNTFLNMLRATNNNSYKVERQNMYLYIFGNKNVDLPAYIKTELDKTVAKILNVQDLGEKADMKDVFKAIVKLSQQMGAKGYEASNKFNIGFTKESMDAKRKINKSNPSTDLVLIIPAPDMVDLSQEASTIYHQAFYQGQNKFYKVIEANIPSGTAYLLDKEALRIQPKLQDTTAERWMDMTTTITTNVWTFAGVFKYINGVKITYSISNTAELKVQAEEVQAEEVQAQTKKKK